VTDCDCEIVCVITFDTITETVVPPVPLNVVQVVVIMEVPPVFVMVVTEDVPADTVEVA
jgi:hypothetical protein